MVKLTYKSYNGHGKVPVHYHRYYGPSKTTLNKRRALGKRTRPQYLGGRKGE